MRDALTNTGEYFPGRYTCPKCLTGILTNVTGEHGCACGARPMLRCESVPSFTAEIIDEPSDSPDGIFENEEKLARGET